MKIKAIDFLGNKKLTDYEGEYSPYHLSNKLDRIHQKGLTGSGVKIGVVDTGFPQFQNEMFGRFNALPQSDPFDSDGHGSWIACYIAAMQNNYGIVGIAKEAMIISYKTLKNGEATDNQIAKDTQQAINDGCQIINYSLGSTSKSSKIKKVMQDNPNVWFICAAGNIANEYHYPAYYSKELNNVLSVGAFLDNEVAYFSGKGADILANGKGISCNEIGEYFEPIGTSMACPEIVGYAAIYKQQYPNRTLLEFKSDLLRTSKTLTNSGQNIEGQALVVNPVRLFGLENESDSEERFNNLEKRVEILENENNFLKQTLGQWTNQ